jgi:RNA polymerase sigma-70 factor (ECF subfamily)
VATASSPLVAPSPVRSGAGRSAVLPRDPGRATEALYKRHGETVFRYAWHLLGRREDAEDATQATFLAAHGALAGGTAVLESGPWLLRIARNECMGRLRQSARRPPVRSLDDGFDPPASGGVEHSAELRDEMRTAQQTLGALPVPEREAFVLREWLGFGAGEAGLALGMSAGDVDGLAARARRSLVIAVGGLEPAISCAGTRAALETGSLDRAAKVHLLRCPVCRGVRRALRPPDAAARPAVAQRLSAVIPGFATGGGGILAALTAKAATAPVLTKTAAIVAAAVATGGAVEQAIVREHLVHRGAHGGQAQTARGAAAIPVPVIASAPGTRGAPAVSRAASSVSFVRQTTRGAAATPVLAHGSRSGGDDLGHSRGRDDTVGGSSGRDRSGDGGRDDTGSAHDGGGGSASGAGSRADSGSDESTVRGESGSGQQSRTSGSDGHHGAAEADDSHSGSSDIPATTAPAPAVATSSDSGDGSSSGKDSGDGGGGGGDEGSVPVSGTGD